MDAQKTDIKQGKKLYWRSRRGLLELDLLLLPFIEHQFAVLSEAEISDYENLLACEDPDILSWLDGREPPDTELEVIVAKIRHWHTTRGSLAST